MVAGLVVVLTGAGAIVAASTGPTTPATHGAATSVTTAAITPTESTSTAAAGAPTASPTPAPTTAAPSPHSRPSRPGSVGGGKALIDTIGADNAAIRDAAKNKGSTALRDACTKVLSDAMAAKSYAPIPDEQAQPHWAKSLPLIVQGAMNCADAIDITGDNALVAQAVGEMNEGFTELNLVVARVNALLG
jgi:hypothetical protein